MKVREDYKDFTDDVSQYLYLRNFDSSIFQLLLKNSNYLVLKLLLIIFCVESSSPED